MVNDIRVFTKKDVEEVVERERIHKEKYGNYECPFCRRFIWWDTSHIHKVGEKTKG